MDDPFLGLVIGGFALLAVALAVGVARFCFGLGRVRRELDRQPTLHIPTIGSLRMLVRLPLAGRFGTPEEQGRHGRFSRVVGEELTARKTGATISAFVARAVVFFTVGRIDPAAWADVLDLVLSVLEREELIDLAVVVRREEFVGDPHPFLEPVWPENYQGDFYDIQTNTHIRFG